MKFKKILFRNSLLETFLYFGLLFILINGTIFLFTLIRGNPRFLIYDSSWIIQIAFPFIFSIIQTSVNRNGILKLTVFNDSKTLTEKIDSLVNNSYIRIVSESGDLNYVKKTKWARFFNYFFRENIKIRVTNNEIMIFAKKNILDSIEMNIKRSKLNF
jgi:hypothetical protein